MLTFKSLNPENVNELRNLISVVCNFTNDEKNVANELIDEYFIQNNKNDYTFILAYEEDTKSFPLVGYICYGKTPMTESTYDLYWIATHPDHLRKGIGKKLVQELFNQIELKNGRLIRLETSSQESYDNTQSFYLNVGFKKVAILKNFYKKNDDLIIYTKDLNL